jgi:branched-chain amino acid transport system ATP-binding protein
MVVSGNGATGRTALSIDGVTVHFGGLVAVSAMSFTVAEGEVVGLIGPNGAGKTTAFNVITGFLRPTRGEVRYRGRSLSGLKPYQIAEAGLVRTFQKTSVFAANTVFENILIGLHRRGRATSWQILLGLPSVRAEEQRLREEARTILDFVGIGHRAGELGGALPYGEQRLLEVAIALAASPSMLLLDEPVSGMNPSETSSFMRLLARIREQGVTVLLVEHDMRMVMGVSDRVVVLNQGKIIAEGSPAEIQGNPEVIRAYLGAGVRHA